MTVSSPNSMRRVRSGDYIRADEYNSLLDKVESLQGKGGTTLNIPGLGMANDPQNPPARRRYVRIDTEHSTPGYYEAVEVEYNNSTQSWDARSSGLTFGDTATTDLPYIRELNELSGLATPAVYEMTKAYVSGNLEQWLFHGNSNSFEDFLHVFKVTAAAGTNVTIGAQRGTGAYAFDDYITVYDGEHGNVKAINKTASENVVCASGNNYIYYRIHRDLAGTWTATPEASSVWPPANVETDQQELCVMVAYVVSGSTNIISIGQVLFHNPMVWASQVTPSFSPINYFGGVIITEGKVRTAFGDTTVASANFATAADAILYIEIISTPGAGPIVNAAIQTVAPAGFVYSDETNGVLTRHYPLGKIHSATSRYEPYHVGDLLEGTLYQPNFNVDVRVNAADPTEGQMLAYKDMTSVGATKNLFFEGRKISLDFEGGQLYNDQDIGEVKLGGDTQDRDQTVVTGGSLVGGTTLRLTRTQLNDECERGLVQDMTTSALGNTDIDLSGLVGISVVSEGPGIDVATVAGNSTITSLLQGSNSIDVTLGVAGAAHTVDTIEQMSITKDANGLKFVNDVASPSAYSQYRVDAIGGAKKWLVPPYSCDDVWLDLDEDQLEIDHEHLGDIDTGDDEYWTSIEWVDSSDVTHTAKIDVRGHILTIDSGTPTYPAQSLLFISCDDGVKYYVADDSVSRTQDKVYEMLISGVTACYIFKGNSNHAVDTSPTSIGSTVYDSCADCNNPSPPSPGDVYAIRKCSDDSLIGYDNFSDIPSADYYWVCVSSVWVKAYTGLVAPGETAGSWNYLEQCGTTPTECADLLGWPMSDDFDGSDCNSGTYGDTNFGYHWTKTGDQQPTYTTYSITGNAFRSGVLLGANGEAYIQHRNTNINHSGEFELIMSVTPNMPAMSDGQAVCAIGLDAPKAIVFFKRNSNDSGEDLKIFTIMDSGIVNEQAFVNGNTYTIRITRDASNLITIYVNGVSVRAETDSDNITNVLLTSADQNNTAATNPTTTIDIHSVSLTDAADGSGDPIIGYDPTGESCP